jgi:hypothetical protein
VTERERRFVMINQLPCKSAVSKSSRTPSESSGFLKRVNVEMNVEAKGHISRNATVKIECFICAIRRSPRSPLHLESPRENVPSFS